LEQFVYFGEQASVAVAEGYLAALERTGALLAKQPQCGTLCHSDTARLQGMRRFRVRGFENYLIFYLPRPNGVEIIRVLHGARDIAGIFAAEEG